MDFSSVAFYMLVNIPLKNQYIITKCHAHLYTYLTRSLRFLLLYYVILYDICIFYINSSSILSLYNNVYYVFVSLPRNYLEPRDSVHGYGRRFLNIR